MKESKYNFNVTIRTNISKKFDYQWFYNQIAKDFNQDKRFEIHTHLVFGHQISVDSAYLKEINAYVSSIGLYLSKEEVYNVCYANCKNTYAFRSNGKIIKCTVDIDEDYHLIGGYNADSINIDEDKNRKLTNFFIKDACKLCSNIIKCNQISCIKHRLQDCGSFERRSYEDLRG